MERKAVSFVLWKWRRRVSLWRLLKQPGRRRYDSKAKSCYAYTTGSVSLGNCYCNHGLEDYCLLSCCEGESGSPSYSVVSIVSKTQAKYFNKPQKAVTPIPRDKF
jgi:hypothetical protein